MPGSSGSSATGRPLRVAWLGPTPTPDGGVPFVGTQVLTALAGLGVEIECFTTGEEKPLPSALADSSNVRYHHLDLGWEWDRWYSRTPLTQFLTGQSSRFAAQALLAPVVVRRHRKRPFDAVYQFSQIELGGLRAVRRMLPPIVLHPEVHARGELSHLWRERRLFDSPIARVGGAVSVMAMRTGIQGRDINLASRVIAPSRVFAECLISDYGLARHKVDVVPNPIPIEGLGDAAARQRPGTPVRILMVSRIAVRKGVEMFVGLSRRLADLEGKVELSLVGGPSLWSDYRPLLSGLDERVARYDGELSPADLYARLGEFHALLQPSHYEPFALTVGEGLAAGCFVIASNAVGAAEDLSGEVARRFTTGDLDELETAVRDIVRLFGDSGWRAERPSLCRAEAADRFSPERVGMAVKQTLVNAAGGR
jgi:glycosyltransferase involved in cell wall biosynthesis